MFNTFHYPQTDDQTKIINKSFDNLPKGYVGNNLNE